MKVNVYTPSGDVDEWTEVEEVFTTETGALTLIEEYEEVDRGRGNDKGRVPVKGGTYAPGAWVNMTFEPDDE